MKISYSVCFSDTEKHEVKALVNAFFSKMEKFEVKALVNAFFL